MGQNEYIAIDKRAFMRAEHAKTDIDALGLLREQGRRDTAIWFVR